MNAKMDAGAMHRISIHIAAGFESELAASSQLLPLSNNVDS